MGDTVNSLLGNDGSPRKLRYKGRVYPARLIDQGVKGEWERWLEDQAVKPFLRLARKNPEAYAAAVKAISQESTARKYAWGGEVSDAALATVGGVVGLLSILLGKEDAPIPETEVQEMFAALAVEVQATLDAVLIDSFPDRGDAMKAKIAEGKKEAETTEGEAAPNP